MDGLIVGLLTILSFCGNNILQQMRLTFGNKCNKSLGIVENNLREFSCAIHKKMRSDRATKIRGNPESHKSCTAMPFLQY